MYIDPNTGGMLFQVLAASLAVFSGIALLFSGKIRAFVARFRRSVREDSPQGEPEPADTESPPSDPSQDIDP